MRLRGPEYLPVPERSGRNLADLKPMTDFPDLFPACDAARILHLSQSTLAKLRLSGNGPVYCKLGRRVVYRLDDLTTWLAARRRRSTSDVGGAARDGS